MSTRIVMPNLFRALAAQILWDRESNRLQYDGPQFAPGVNAPPVQLRWQLHPGLGLPRNPFVVWTAPDPGGGLTHQQMADQVDWRPIEVVGLPVDDTWVTEGYPLGPQGPRDAPLSPRDAANQRLRLGAPRIGWRNLSIDDMTLPAWQPSAPERYLEDVVRGRLVRGIRDMLTQEPNPFAHAAFVDREAADQHDGTVRLQPRLAWMTPGTPGMERPSKVEWHPLGLLAVSVGSDSLASLALGFGTALDGEAGQLFMVTVDHVYEFLGVQFDAQLAAIARVSSFGDPAQTDNLQASFQVRHRASRLDEPAAEGVVLTWNRAPSPMYSAGSESDFFPTAYAIGRMGPRPHQAEILLTPRPAAVGGWLPYTPGRPVGTDAPSRFTEAMLRNVIVAGQSWPDALPRQATYAVAAADIFGRYSYWSTVQYDCARESPQAPSVVRVEVEPDGRTTIDFAWDWAERSPEFMELSGNFVGEPALLSATFQFGGHEQPVPDPLNLIPLDAALNPVAAFGPAQDGALALLNAPEQRYYRLVTNVPLDFGGQRFRTFQVRARGQCFVHNRQIPMFNISAFGPAREATVWDPQPPVMVLPAQPEAPLWASLPDPTGVSRFALTWPAAAGAHRFAVWETTETSVLNELGTSPDLARSKVDRLAALRAANLPGMRNLFRRVGASLIEGTSYEVALPPGSSVIHLYAITAANDSQVESAWPGDSHQFFAVAAPRLSIPNPPALEAEPGPEGQPPSIALQVLPMSGPPAAQVELFRSTRTELATSADSMGPPLTVLNAGGPPPLAFTDATVTPRWRPVWYRAVAWSADDPLNGLVGARSAPSAPVRVVLPPVGPPDVSDVRVNEAGSTGSECLISWTSVAPVELTPLGSHSVIVVARDAAGAQVARIEGALDSLPTAASVAAIPPPAADRRAVRVPQPAGYRLYVWLPRPAADAAFDVTVKMIDPLGRIGSATSAVPPLPPLPAPQLGSVRVLPHPAPAVIGPLARIEWDILTPIEQQDLAKFTLSAEVRWSGVPVLPPVTVRATLETVPTITAMQLTPLHVPLLLGHLVRLAGTQHYLLVVRRGAALRVAVRLENTLGQTDSKLGHLP